jgi:hypothetical protein
MSATQLFSTRCRAPSRVFRILLVLAVGPAVRAGEAEAPTGACCGNSTCQDMFEDDCLDRGFQYQGDDTECATTTCVMRFRRGDHHGDGLVDVTDALHMMDFIFLWLGGDPGICSDASDFDNSGARDISDPILLLAWLFLGGVPISPPGAGPDCGPDPDVVLDPDGPGPFPQTPAVSIGCDLCIRARPFRTRLARSSRQARST